MAWLEDLASVLVAQGVGVVNTNIFYTSKANIPVGAGPYLSMLRTGGSGTDNTHDEAPHPSYVFPGAQILVRGANPVQVEAMVTAAFNALTGIHNQVINGVWYRKVRALQSPFDMGLDDTGSRIVYAFNVLGERARV